MAYEFTGRFETLQNLQRSVSGERATVARFHTITSLAKRLIPGCDAGGLALEVRGSTYSVGATDDVVLQVDLVQYDTREGPCLAAIDTGRTIRVDVLDPGEDWRHFAPGAVEAGILSVLSTPLNAPQSTIGALNLYSFSTDAFDDEAAATARILADYATEVLLASPLYAYSVELVDEVLKELSSREMIAAAIGMLMAHGDCDVDEARRRLEERAARRSETLLATAEWELRENQFRPPPDTEPDAPRESG
jgi:GAF domain-containing protein